MSIKGERGLSTGPVDATAIEYFYTSPRPTYTPTSAPIQATDNPNSISISSLIIHEDTASAERPSS
jgi:hypothetical protein